MPEAMGQLTGRGRKAEIASTADDGGGQLPKSEALGCVEPGNRGDKPEKRLTRQSLL